MKRPGLALPTLVLVALTSLQTLALDVTPGRIDPTFVARINPGIDPGVIPSFEHLEVQPDGKLLLAGYFDNAGGEARINLARLNADGQLDRTFSPDEWPDGTILAVGVQSDGRILVAGYFRRWGQRSVRALIRLHPDGRFDEDFAQPVLPRPIESLLVLKDDRILYSGRSIIGRLQPDGEPDDRFQLEPGFSGTARDLLVDPQGRIVAAGQFFGPERLRTCVLRLLPDGARDPSFTFAIWETVAHDIELQPDGRLLVAGDFNSWDSIPPPLPGAVGGVIRLRSDGAWDPTFKYGSPLPTIVDSVALQSNGRILVGAGAIFWEPSGGDFRNLSRLEPDGSLDRGFDPERGSDWSGQVIRVLPDGRFLAGGGESLRGGLPRCGLRRYFSDPPSARVFVSENTVDFRWPVLPPELPFLLEESEDLDPSKSVWQTVTDVQVLGQEWVVRRPRETVVGPKFLRLRAP